MSSFQNTPAQYAAIDKLLRAHLKDAIADLNAAVVFQKAGDNAGFTFATNSALYERAWFDPATSVIEGSYPHFVTSYRGSVDQAKQSVSACLGGTPGPSELPCHRLQAHEMCSAGQLLACESDVLNEQTKIEGFVVAMVQNPAPDTQTVH